MCINRSLSPSKGDKLLVLIIWSHRNRLRYISGWLHEGFGSYDEAFYIAGSVAIVSSLMLFGVDCMIRRQFKASRLVEHRHTKNDTSLISSDNSSTSDSGYKDTEAQPMLEDEFSSTHFNLKISELLMITDRETFL